MKSLLILFAFFLAFLNILPFVNGQYNNTWNCCSGTTCVADGCYNLTVSSASQCITDQCTVGTCRPECGAACSPPQTQSCSYCSGNLNCLGGTQTCQSNCQYGSCSGGSCSCTAGQCGASCSSGQTQSCIVGGQSGTQTCGNCQWGSCALNPYFIGGTFNITAYIEYLNVFWEAAYPSHSQVAINCTFYGKSVQPCSPNPYIQPPGKGSCTVVNPNYDYTKQNEVRCRVYDPANPSLYNDY